MNGNFAYQEEPREELLNGKTYMMSSPSVNHHRTASNIYYIFLSYLKGKNCSAFGDGVDVYLTENDRVIPDVMIVCDRNIILQDGIHGAPDLIVEALSPSTAKNDKDLLCDGKYQIDGYYGIFPDALGFTEKERAESRKEIRPSLYPDLCIPLEEIFHDLF